MSKAWMPFYGGDFIGNTMHLSRGAIGSYVLLLWHHWEHGSLPADENALRRIARCQGGAPWTALWRQLKPFFHIRQDNPDRIYSTRALAELSRNAEISNKRKGAALQMHSKCRASAEHLHTQSQSHLLTSLSSSPSSPSNQSKSSPLNGNGVSREKKREEVAEVSKPPRHGARSRDGQLVYFKRGTSEFDAHMRDYQEGTGKEPMATSHGRWFRILGEVVSRARK